jgi:CxxC-x17-CxxC domain-containing protein
MEYRDKSLVCVECRQPFVWTAGEQLFFADKNFKNEPKRCKNCKAKRNARMTGGSGSSGGGRERVETVATCSQCGKETTVPFRPTQGRPVFCKECFQARKGSATA